MNKIEKLKILAISDLHGHLPIFDNSSEIMIIAGDIMPLEIQFNKELSKYWLENNFSNWIKELSVDKVFLVAGNHDAYFESISNLNLKSFLESCDNKLIYLKNETVEYIDKIGLKWTLFGTPYCHIFGHWPFMRSDEYMIEKFKNIPDEVDIIISHDPPFDIGNVDVILDIFSDSDFSYYNNFNHLGNKPLSDRIQHVNYKLLVCGHIHGGNHNYDHSCKSVNVSYLNEDYEPFYKPFYFEIEKEFS